MRGYRILLLKAYLDKGLSLTNYVKYLITFFGLASSDVKTTLIIAFVYAFISFFIGYFWFKYKLIDTENEIGNKFNPFQREVRRKLNRKT